MASRTLALLAVVILVALTPTVPPIQQAEAAPAAQVTCPTGQYRAEWWNNKTLSGTSSLVRCEAAPINYYVAESASPAPGINGNGPWSVRWQGNFVIAAGSQTFTATTDDGMRVWVDGGSAILNKWFDQPATTYTASKSLSSAATHNVKVEFYQNAYDATAKLSWTGGTATATPTPAATSTATATATQTSTPTAVATATSTPPAATATATLAATVTPTQIVPVAGQTCPQWVHDQYVKLGPDGQPYNKWHPQKDPQFGCYMRHEHGNAPMTATNPDGSAWEPFFGYAAARGGANEPHTGFKNYALEQAGFGGYQWDIVHHFGTGSAGRVCVEFHEVDIAVKRVSDNMIVADLHVLADHGHSVDANGAVYTPVSCPNQGTLAGPPFHGQRQVPLWDQTQYEPWDGDVPAFLTGEMFRFSPNTPSVIMKCVDLTCAVVNSTNELGLAARFITSDTYGIRNATHTGTFYTDSKGSSLLPLDDIHAVRQYILAGLDAGWKVHPPDEQCWYRPSESDPMTCQVGRSDLDNVDNALMFPN